MQYFFLITGALLLAYIVYFSCNKGMARNARGQQTRRLGVAAVLACIPLTVAQVPVTTPSLLLVAGISGLWMLTYPLLYHLTHRKSSPDYENYMDIDFGLYLFGGLSGLLALLAAFLPDSRMVSTFVATAEVVLVFIPLFQIIYYLTYRVCIDSTGMKTIQETDRNEIIEFFRSFAWWQNLAAVVPVVAAVAGVCFVNFAYPVPVPAFGRLENAEAWVRLTIVGGLTIFLLVYTWKRHHGVFGRTGIATLYADVKEYIEGYRHYAASTEKRVSTLEAEALGQPTEKAGTVVLVIGESGCRDFMSAFHEDLPEDTTPWLRACKKDSEHFVLFPNAYSCSMQTVPSLERALTEFNQYNDKDFSESCSVVDMAHKLGYRVHWYSNQGHLGTFDTPISLVAETADVAKWTHQEVGKVQYDASLLDFLDEVDPTKNNFVVLHLIGSHFNFINRYPQEFTRWGKPGVQDNVVNYKNSLAYTDMVLEKVFDYARQRLNLRAMVYCSDHATEPGRRRKPNFDGFQMTRIPLFAYLSSEYRSLHPGRMEALQSNAEKYVTNDLLYDLICGIFDVRSNCFDESQSLASTSYRFKREELLTYEGKKHIKDDDESDR